MELIASYSFVNPTSITVTITTTISASIEMYLLYYSCIIYNEDNLVNMTIDFVSVRNSVSFDSINTHIIGVTNVFGGIRAFKMAKQLYMDFDIDIAEGSVNVTLGPRTTFQSFHINYLVILFPCNSNCLTC